MKKLIEYIDWDGETLYLSIGGYPYKIECYRCEVIEFLGYDYTGDMVRVIKDNGTVQEIKYVDPQDIEITKTDLEEFAYKYKLNLKSDGY